MNDRALQRISWLPAHPLEGSISMNRYWRALHAASRLIADRTAIDCPLGEPGPVVRRTSRLKRAWCRYAEYPWRLRSYRWSPIVHVLDHSSAFLLRQVPSDVRKIVTVHDLIPLRDRQQMTKLQYRRFVNCVQPIRFADVVVAVSNQTAGDVTQLLDVPCERIVVIPNGVDDCFGGSSQGCTQLPRAMANLQGRPVILSIGSLQKRKNLDMLPPVLSLLRRRLSDVCLLRVGDRLDDRVRGLLTATLGSGALVELGKVDDELLPLVYSASSVLFFPSTYEGFGLPVLEAMAAGCPVVCSGATSLPEAGGQAALYFDVHSPTQAADALFQVLSDGDLRRRMRQAGVERARDFTWKRHLASLMDVYARFVQDPCGVAVLKDASDHLRELP